MLEKSRVKCLDPTTGHEFRRFKTGDLFLYELAELDVKHVIKQGQLPIFEVLLSREAIADEDLAHYLKAITPKNGDLLDDFLEFLKKDRIINEENHNACNYASEAFHELDSENLEVLGIILESTESNNTVISIKDVAPILNAYEPQKKNLLVELLGVKGKEYKDGRYNLRFSGEEISYTLKNSKSGAHIRQKRSFVALPVNRSVKLGLPDL